MSESYLDGIYNYNPQVTGLTYGDTPDYSCWQVSGTIGIDISLDTVTGISRGSLDSDSSCDDTKGGSNPPSKSWWAEMNTDSQFAGKSTCYCDRTMLMFHSVGEHLHLECRPAL